MPMMDDNVTLNKIRSYLVSKNLNQPTIVGLSGHSELKLIASSGIHEVL